MGTLKAELWTADGVPWKTMALTCDVGELEIPVILEPRYDYSDTSDPPLNPSWSSRRFKRVGLLDDGTIVYRETR